MNPGLRYRKTWSRDAHQLMIKIPRQRLAAHAATADPLCAGLRRSMDEADGLVGLIAHLCRDLANARGLSAHASLRREMEDLLLSATGCDAAAGCAATTASPAICSAPKRISARMVGRSVGISELVAVTGVSERALQQAFRRYRDCSPSEFSRDIRLDAARAALLAGEGVTETALEFGFPHFGRFAQSYAARFGEKPSETVKRARH